MMRARNYECSLTLDAAAGGATRFCRAWQCCATTKRGLLGGLSEAVDAGTALDALSARGGLNGAVPGVDSSFELIQRIGDLQQHYFPSGIAQVFRDPKHPADGVNFCAQIRIRITNAGFAFATHELRRGVDILKAIAEILEASLNLFLSPKICLAEDGSKLPD
jgi:hypothetical protein